MGNPKISDCEAVLKKQAAAIRKAAATLDGSIKTEERVVAGKTRKIPIADPADVKKAEDQYKKSCADAGYQYELMRKWFEPGKNAAVNDFEKAGREWAKSKKAADAAYDPTEFPMVDLIKDANKK